VSPDSLFYFLSSGMVLGLSSGIAPGPLLTVTISETMRGGFPAGLRICFAPIITDAPLIILSWLVLSKLESLSLLLGIISLLGAGFLARLARASFKVNEVALPAADAASGALRKGVLTNLLNPAPYVFWVTVGAPLVLAASKVSTACLIAFLGGFFVCIIGAKVLVAAAVVRFREFLRSRVYLLLMKTMGIALAVFALLFLKQAWLYLTQ